ncbi:armadillo-type protein [Powellomyces hirtus]|nr:armadillo-type protein [Powellomyces hirtus]
MQSTESPKGVVIQDQDVLVRREQKIHLKKKNEEAFVYRPDIETLKGLDGSIKKNTSFVRKLKSGLTHDQVGALSKELLSLKLEKYISEIVTAISEARFKTTPDIWAAVEICSLLHQRFAAFTPELVPVLLRQLGPPPNTHGMSVEQAEKEESTRIAKQRSTLRLIAELYSVGIVRDSPRELVMPNILKEMLITDKDRHVNLSIAVTFVKYYGRDFTGIEAKTRGRRNSSASAIDNENGVLSPEESAPQTAALEDLIPADVKAMVKSILLAYYDSLEHHLVQEHGRIRRTEKANHEHYIHRGEINEERQERYQKALKAYEKLFAGAQTLAECLDRDLPDLPEDQSTTRIGIGITEGAGERDDKDPSSSVWEDDDAKAFYENLIDLRNHVPAIFLGKKKERKDEVIPDTADANSSETPSPTDTAEDIENDASHVSDDQQLDNGDVDDEPEVPKAEEDDKDVDEEEDGDKKKAVSGANQAALDALLNRLPNAMNRDTIDQISIEFAFLNAKGTRKKLIRTLLAVPRQRLDLLPYYSRMIATLYPYIPEIGIAVVDQLEKSFHGHQKRKEQVFIEEKTKNIRYIAELTKFKVTPTHVVFHCIKFLLDNFKHHNIELLCTLLETCGRFLYKSPETSTRASNYLDILMRKKNVENVDSRQVFMIDNAFYQCNPPDKPAITAKVRPPIELYVQKLIYADLSKKTVEKILKQLRKLNWDLAETRHMMNKIFGKVWKVKYSHLHMMAFMASELSRYYPEFGVSIVDNTLEEIRIGLEENIFKHNQRRIAVAKYLGELYNYRMVESALIFETLFRIVSFGHENNLPRYGVGTPLDAQQDFFRVRLCCTILDTCGTCFDRGSMAKRLNLFLAFFQMYINTKPRPPMDIEFTLSDTFELLRPKLVILQTYEEAAAAYGQLATEQYQATQNGGDNGIGDASDDEDDDEDEGGADRRGQSADDDEEDDNDSKNQPQADEEDGGIDDDEAVIVHMQHDVDEEADEDFEREFSRMMQESVEGRRTDRKSVFDAPVPTRLKTATAPLIDKPDSEEGDQVAFTLLTKKGNKQQARTMALPADISFVINTRNKQEAEQEEKQHLKQLVLSYEEREREAAKRASMLEENATWNGRHPVLLSTSAQRGAIYRGSGRGRGHSSSGRGRGYMAPQREL